MKNGTVFAGAVALAMTVASQVGTMGATNGMILIITRFEQDLTWQGEDGDAYDGDDYKGPGACSPGDVAMAELLGDFGYSTRVVISREVDPRATNPFWPLRTGNPDAYLHPLNADFDAALVIQSGSGSSSYAPPIATNGVPVMSGEVACLSDNINKAGSLFMYKNNDGYSDAYGPTSGQYMKVLQPQHPIMQGIPLDAQGRVKIIRDAYPEENAHVPPSGYLNWGPYDYPVQWVSNAAPATTVLGVLETDTNRSCFAVVDVGTGQLLANGQPPTVRLVHYYVCEGGSTDSRRCFNALTDLGRVIFVRAAKWAMGETLQPYKPLGIVDVSLVGSQKIKLSWQSSADKNYKIVGTDNLAGPADFSNWQTIVQDIPGTGATVSRTLDISGATQVAYLRVKPMP